MKLDCGGLALSLSQTAALLEATAEAYVRSDAALPGRL